MQVLPCNIDVKVVDSRPPQRKTNSRDIHLKKQLNAFQEYLEKVNIALRGGCLRFYVLAQIFGAKPLSKVRKTCLKI
jgi:hypothetical protein